MIYSYMENFTCPTTIRWDNHCKCVRRELVWKEQAMVYKIKSVSSNSTSNRFSNCLDNFIPANWSIGNVQFIFHIVKYKLKRLKTRRVFNLFYLEQPTFRTQYFGPYEAQLTDIKSLILYQGFIYDKVIYKLPLTFCGLLFFSNYKSLLSHSS